MSVLVVVIFPYATTASAAAEDARQLDGDLAPSPGALATVVCDDRGDYWVTTSHPGDPHDPRAAFWFLLFNALIFTPTSGARDDLTRRTLARRLGEAGIDRAFQRAIHEELGPDSSALFLLLEEAPGPDALDVLRRFAGAVHITMPSARAEALLAQALYAVPPGAAASVAETDVPPASGVGNRPRRIK